MNDWQHWLGHFLRLAAVALFIGLAYFVIQYALPLTVEVFRRLGVYLLPFLLGAMIALLIEPVVEFLTKKTGLSRTLTTFVTLLLFLGLVSVGLVVVISRLVVEMVTIASSLPSPQFLTNAFTEWTKAVAPYYELIHSSPEIYTTVERIAGEGVVAVKNMAVSGSNYLLDMITSLPSFFTILAFSLVASYFFSRDKGAILQLVYNVVPNDRAAQVRQVILELGDAFVGFVRAQVILVSITGLLTIIGLYLLDNEYAFTIGILTGIMDLLPILGPGLVFLPWIIWELLTGQFPAAANLSILYGILVLNRQFIEPKVVADSIGLHPLATLTALYVGLKAFGVIGVIIGPTIVLLLVSMHRAGVFKNFRTR
ncbi:sporulation integral membrane protein YtvI [Heliobacterium undosum]|uniref:Sporulation integral membrane protein YtvI n=1 Tax=Heliomicrobium undosum TaxID=121734 RepID=A0A845L7D9_9FIRM|nr:sporulation integral membrane protein YtvI [Heliomicrobium undosum]MZP30570.1 sporulation integral membrane protein YtvI [Heliomicrobium undosum]